MEKPGIMENGSGCQVSRNPTKKCSPRGDKNHAHHNVHIMNGRNAVGRIIPPVVIFKGQAYRSEFADSFPSGSFL
jgi:hypothetical protein